ncbi:hypothetical protein FRC17_007891 [Serendipita sp. 399]|nr:hypothetical protein FRC17_007891 [Serendipita sp. 399]
MPSSDPAPQPKSGSSLTSDSQRLGDSAAIDKTSSRLADHLSPSPEASPAKGVRLNLKSNSRKRQVVELSEDSDDNAPVRDRGSPEQTVLSTVGASWSLATKSKPFEGAKIPEAVSTAEAVEIHESSRNLNAIVGKDSRQLKEDKVLPVKRKVPIENHEDEVMEVEHPVNPVSRSRQPHRGSKDLSTTLGFDNLHVSPKRPSRERPREDHDVIMPVIHASSGTSRPTRSSAPEPATTAQEIVRTTKNTVFTMSFDLMKVCRIWNNASENVQPRKETAPNDQDEGIQATALEGEDAEDLLNRVVEKEDFKHMEILGQFNLGFIIVRLRKSARTVSNATQGPSSDSSQDHLVEDLFIVDQHAADEKYNFETLQLTTRIESQKLFQPRTLELSASDRLVALENLETLQRNGFEVKLQSDSSDEIIAQLQLIAQPVSKSTVFDASDLMELIHLLHDKPSGTMVRCSKARAMFASRACRKSVMIGHPLTRPQMTNVGTLFS